MLDPSPSRPRRTGTPAGIAVLALALLVTAGCKDPQQVAAVAQTGSQAAGALRDYYKTLSDDVETTLQLEAFLSSLRGEERDTLRTDYVQARDNYWKARGQRFNDDDPMVQDLQQKVGAAQQRIETAGQRLDDIAGFLDMVTEAVNLGSRLVSLAAV